MVDARPFSNDKAGGYRVLARKYRPTTFDDLIGQDAMVRTLSNAFETGRIHQAYMLTGVRGVGKTTTARILARGLQYEPMEGPPGGPTIRLPALGKHCEAIIGSRHIDVLELDAASHNGVSDIREITESLRYAPQSARFRLVIMDEVHMLSTPAFNALLKTLEEPPAHAKFIFATTEIRKVPITILSRCQRFDLRRVDAALLAGHLARICDAEGVTVEPEALAMISRAAEGSVRDSLSLLDQAIAHGNGRVDAESARQMLGLADRGRIIDLFEAVMAGDAARSLAELRAQYDLGADPSVVLSELAEFSHFVTRLKVSAEASTDASITEVERQRGQANATSLSMKVLTRFWQMLLKGIAEVQAAPKPLAAADMLLVRLCYAADLPTPDDLIRSLGDGQPRSPERTPPSGGGGAPTSGPRAVLATSQPARSPAPAVEPTTHRSVGTFIELVALAAEKRDLPLKLALERFVRPVSVADGRLDIALDSAAPAGLINDLSRKLSDWTGRRWVVALSSEGGEATLREQAEARQAATLTGIRAEPLVRAALERFPGAEIIDIRDNAPDLPTAVARGSYPMDDDALDGDIDDNPYGAEDI
jgi:DNA polymerase-3 subunit gamma/tau